MKRGILVLVNYSQSPFMNVINFMVQFSTVKHLINGAYENCDVIKAFNKIFLCGKLSD